MSVPDCSWSRARVLRGHPVDRLLWRPRSRRLRPPINRRPVPLAHRRPQHPLSSRHRGRPHHSGWCPACFLGSPRLDQHRLPHRNPARLSDPLPYQRRPPRSLHHRSSHCPGCSLVSLQASLSTKGRPRGPPLMLLLRLRPQPRSRHRPCWNLATASACWRLFLGSSLFFCR